MFLTVRALAIFIFVTAAFVSSYAQQSDKMPGFSRADTLRGFLSEERSCYDVTYYHLDVRIDIDRKFISGSTFFSFKALTDFTRLQFDLFANMEIEKVMYKGQSLRYQREENAVFIDFPEPIRTGTHAAFTVYYKGNPTIAHRAPWDGGFVFSTDKAGKPWVGVACQGAGASLWWPNKDHQSDKADSVLISVAVPDELMDVSNGRLRKVEDAGNGYKKYHWFVSCPINNYNVTLNVADYAHIQRKYQGIEGQLDMDYYVLKENKQKTAHLDTNVYKMLDCFEDWFGPYPFYRDGYKLVETPYLGMEHQSAIAYGNGYQNGYRGQDLSATGYGNFWDYIVIHESGHEWFGNHITATDIADMWIHEAFTTYSEGIFVACTVGKEAGAAYIKGLRASVKNDKPIIGPYYMNQKGSDDMYYKGANLLQTIRTAINNDSLFKEILRGLNKALTPATTDTKAVVAYFNRLSGRDFTAVFNQYLRYTAIPELVLSSDGNNRVTYYWKADEPGFDLPVQIKLPGAEQWEFIYPNTSPQTLTSKTNLSAIQVDTGHMYIKVKKTK